MLDQRVRLDPGLDFRLKFERLGGAQLLQLSHTVRLRGTACCADLHLSPAGRTAQSIETLSDPLVGWRVEGGGWRVEGGG